MRSKKLITLLLGVLGLWPLGAQTVSHHCPRTHLSPEVQRLRRLRVPFRATTRQPMELPPAVDNSRQPYFPPIINQMGGSCAQAAGIGYMFTYEINRLLDRDASASADNRMSYQFAWNMVNDGEDQGGFVEQGLQLAQHYGIMSESDYGKNFLFKWPSGYDKYFRAMHHRAEKIYTFDDSIPLMKRYLYDKGDGSATGGILTFSAQAEGWTIDDNYQGPSLTGYHSLLTRLATDGAHAMTIAGYDDTVTYTDASGHRHTGAFIAINSWGENWQDRGRFYLPYDFFRDPSVSNLTLGNSVNGVSVRTYEPQVILKVKLDYTSRDDLRFSVATTANLDDATPRSQHIISAFNKQGGDHPMTGPYFGSEIELAIDMTEQTKADDVKYFLNISRLFGGRKKGEGRLLALSAIDYRSSQPKEYLYRGQLPATLADGYNYFPIPLRPRYTVSASPISCLRTDGIPKATAYRIRTAMGHEAKMMVVSRDADTGNIRLHYAIRR